MNVGHLPMFSAIYFPGFKFATFNVACVILKQKVPTFIRLMEF